MPDVQAPMTIDRRQLREDLRSVAKVLGKIGAEKMKSFLRENEVQLPFSRLLLSQGMQSILRSRVDRLCELPEPDLRNVLSVVRWQLSVALGEADPQLRPYRHPAVRASMDRALEAMLQGATEALALPDEDPTPAAVP